MGNTVTASQENGCASVTTVLFVPPHRDTEYVDEHGVLIQPDVEVVSGSSFTELQPYRNV
jgi:predicted adenine nucleotide alpha hydrolase (AANH) superfamily ATPase